MSYRFQPRIVGIPRNDWNSKKSGHLEEVLRRGRWPAELLRVGEVEDGRAAVGQLLAKDIRDIWNVQKCFFYLFRPSLDSFEDYFAFLSIIF